MDKQFAYLLFIKIHRTELQNYITNYMEQLTIDDEQKRTGHLITTSFLSFLAGQMKNRQLDEDALHYWVQVHRQSVHANHSIFLAAFHTAIEEVLRNYGQPNASKIEEAHAEITSLIQVAMQQWLTIPFEDPFTSEQYKQLDAFSLDLIQLNGIEDLAILLKRAEEIFHFKRAIFFSYNPWLEEFSGVIGAELDKIERMRGKIAIEPVFAIKKPLFLKTPSPYVQQIAIDLFQLSSIVFIPVIHENQLYGWLSFDQKGVPFDCDQQQLQLLTEVGNRLAMYLARKQLRHSMNRQLDLNEKELMILYLLVEGYSNKEMAQLMYISEFTVRDYVKKLMQKIHAKNRTHLIAQAFRIGLVD